MRRDYNVMNGLALSRSYHDAHIDALLAPYAAQRARIATGMVGHGSECFGFDDALSRDHDFGPGFCVWLRRDDFEAFGADLQAAYERLPGEHAGVAARVPTARAGQRVGVFATPAFYSQFLGAPNLPMNDADWLQIPEVQLAAAVNGEVFSDPLGEFSWIRDSLSRYYPDSIRRRKLAAATARMAQSGQYNLPRVLQRGEAMAAQLALAEFMRQTCLLAHALHRRYAPIDKWLHRSLCSLPAMLPLAERLSALAVTPPHQAGALVEAISAELLQALIAAGLTEPGDSFLEAHVDNIRRGTVKEAQG